MDAEEAASLSHEALVDEERTEIDTLLHEVRGLRPTRRRPASVANFVR